MVKAKKATKRFIKKNLKTEIERRHKQQKFKKNLDKRSQKKLVKAIKDGNDLGRRNGYLP